MVEDARVLSSLLARAADVDLQSLAGDIESYRQAGVPDAGRGCRVVQLRVVEISALLDYLFRRQLLTELTRQVTADADSLDARAAAADWR